MQRILNGAEGQPVQITTPSPRFMKACTSGGLGELPGDAVTIDLMENEAKRIEASKSMPFARALDNMIRTGYDSRFAARYLKALIGGGEVTATALDLVREHAHRDRNDQVLINSELLQDWTFRHAWRRKGDGFIVDITAAKTITAERLLEKRGQEMINLTRQVEIATLVGNPTEELELKFNTLKQLDMKVLSNKIMSASTPDDLKGILYEYR